MTGRFIVTELGQTFVAIVDDGDGYVVAGREVPDTSPEILGEAAEAVYGEWLQWGAYSNIGEWLNRELLEGRAQLISAHFEVAV